MKTSNTQINRNDDEKTFIDIFIYRLRNEQIPLMKIDLFVQWIMNEDYDSDAIQMDMDGHSKGNIQNVVNDEKLIKSVNSFITTNLSYVNKFFIRSFPISS